MRKIKFLSVFVLLAMLFSATTGTVLADDPAPNGPPPDIVERQAIEPIPGAELADEPVLGPPPGYRADEPSTGAVVHRVEVRPLDGQVQSLNSEMRPMATYRSGWTDGWHDWIYPITIRHVGSHNSDSDLDEDQIGVDGFMRIGGPSWDDSCDRHISGTSAHCRTEVTANFFYSFYVESHHSFHTAGYPDTYFETGKSI